MLVLTRKKAESIRIGEDIVVKVLHTGRHAVKIGIDAPQTVRVLRAELSDPDAGEHPLAVFLKTRAPRPAGGTQDDAGSSVPRPAFRLRPR